MSPTIITIFFVLNIGTVSAIAIFLLAYFVGEKNRLFAMLRNAALALALAMTAAAASAQDNPQIPRQHHAWARIGVDALFDNRDSVLCDAWVHPSVADGIRLSGARAIPYRNDDLDETAACALAESAWQTRIAFDLSAFRVPNVS